MRARRLTDRGFAVHVNNDSVGVNEDPGVMQVQRITRIALVVEQFVRVFRQTPCLVRVRARPTLFDVNLARPWESAAWEITRDGDLGFKLAEDVPDRWTSDVSAS